MDLLKMNLFQHGLVKQAKFLISSPQKAQRVLGIMETGVVAIEPAPLNATGFINASEEIIKKAWANIHALKLQVYKLGQPVQGDSVLAISERNYKPLDPLGIMTNKETEKLASLADIAKVRHAQARAAASGANPIKDIAVFIIQWCFVIILLEVIGGVLMGAFGG